MRPFPGSKMPLSVAIVVIRALIAGNVSVHRSTEEAEASLAGCCEGHGGELYREGNLIVCADNHICVIVA